MSPARMMLGRGTPRPPVARRADFSGCNIVTDGNSISANYYGTTIDDLIAERMKALGIAGDATFSTKGGAAISGQTWDDMKNNHADLDALWVPGRTNYLVCGETTNAVFNNNTSADRVMADAKGYIAAVNAVHPWRVLVWGSLPRGHANDAAYPWDAGKNARMLDIDQRMAADPAGLGCEVFVDARKSSPMFNHDGTDPARFRAYASLWNEREDGSQGHWNDIGWTHPWPGDWATSSTPATGKKAIAAAIVDGLQAMGA